MSFINRFAILSIMLLSFLLLSPVHAASACKGLSKSSCGSKSSCTWVDGYKRKDGKQVSAYCRTVSKKKSSDSKKSTKTSSSSSKSTQETKSTKKAEKKSTKDKKASTKSDKKSTKDSKKKADKKAPKKDAKKDTKKSS